MGPLGFASRAAERHDPMAMALPRVTDADTFHGKPRRGSWRRCYLR